jgi:hypothetical protein
MEATPRRKNLTSEAQLRCKQSGRSPLSTARKTRRREPAGLIGRANLTTTQRRLPASLGDQAARLIRLDRRCRIRCRRLRDRNGCHAPIASDPQAAPALLATARRQHRVRRCLPQARGRRCRRNCLRLTSLDSARRRQSLQDQGQGRWRREMRATCRFHPQPLCVRAGREVAASPRPAFVVPRIYGEVN